MAKPEKGSRPTADVLAANPNATVDGKLWVCQGCGYVYDGTKGPWDTKGVDTKRVCAPDVRSQEQGQGPTAHESLKYGANVGTHPVVFSPRATPSKN